MSDSPLNTKLRILIADDERPARMFLKNLLEGFEEVEIIGEAEDGAEALELIEQIKPDLALLDLQMPELSGLEVVKLLPKNSVPLIVFVTADDLRASQAFEDNSIDYLLKPVVREELREVINRAVKLLAQSESLDKLKVQNSVNLRAAVTDYEKTNQVHLLERIPVRQNDAIILLPVSGIVSIVAEGELLHLTTIDNESFTIDYRLKDLEARLDSSKFVRLSRGALANVDFIARVNPQPGGTYLITFKNDQQLPVSRIQSKILREQLFKL